MSLDQVRAIADAVLYEGYLLYPYRATTAKNQSRWQFGVLGPPGASAESFGEAPGMQMQCLLRSTGGAGTVVIRLIFLQLQIREVQRLKSDGTYAPVDELTVDDKSMLTWDEAVEREYALAAQSLQGSDETTIEVPGGEDIEPLTDAAGTPVGRIVRRRWPLSGRVRVVADDIDGFVRLTIAVNNEHQGDVCDKDTAIRTSFIGAYLLLEAHDADFVSLLEPAAEAATAASQCGQQRCFPVLAGPKGSTDVVLASPIILYDYPEIADESLGNLFDSTEIDEILSLRVMTMTDEEKAEARATDPRAAAIIDRCDNLTEADLQQLHGVLRDPHAGAVVGSEMPMELHTPGLTLPSMDSQVPWWEPEADNSVSPDTDAVIIDGVSVARGSLVLLHPSRSADAQDLFFAERIARVSSVHFDVDGSTHVGVLLLDDPASELLETHGRSLYFAPDEVEPLPAGFQQEQREESRS